jgi:tRNA(Arg) A34 adenosine deaminase TadA
VHAPANLNVVKFDQDMMRRCIEIAVQSGHKGEYPYGAVITRAGKVIVE